MTRGNKRSVPRKKMTKLADVMGGREQIAAAIGVSRGAVDRYCVGYGMRQETFDRLTALVVKHVDEGQPAPRVEVASPVAARVGERMGIPRPTFREAIGGQQGSLGPTLRDEGGHLFRLLTRALGRNVGIESISAQLNRMERRLQRIEGNQERLLKAWQMDPVR